MYQQCQPLVWDSHSPNLGVSEELNMVEEVKGDERKVDRAWLSGPFQSQVLGCAGGCPIASWVASQAPKSCSVPAADTWVDKPSSQGVPETSELGSSQVFCDASHLFANHLYPQVFKTSSQFCVAPFFSFLHHWIEGKGVMRVVPTVSYWLSRLLTWSVLRAVLSQGPQFLVLYGETWHESPWVFTVLPTFFLFGLIYLCSSLSVWCRNLLILAYI